MSSHRRVRRQFRIRTLTIAVAVLAVVAVGLPVASAQLPSDLTDGATSAGLDPSALDQAPTDRSPGLDPGTGAAAAGIAAAGIGAAGIGAAEVGATQPDPDTAEDVASSVEGTGQALAAGAADPPPDESAPLYQVTSGGQAETVDREQAFPAGATTDDTSGQDQAQDKQANRICGPRQINGKVDIFCWNEGETPPGEPVDTTPPPVPAPPAPVAPACPFTVGDSDGNCVPDAQDPDWVDPATGIRNWDNPDWRDDDLDTIPNSRDPYPNGECVPDTTQDADCDGIRNTADRDRLRAAGNTEMVRQWECSEYKLARDCDLNWVDPLTNPQRDRDGDGIADHMDPRDDRRPMPTQAPPTPAPAPAPEEVAPTPVGGSLGVRPSQMPALIEFGAIRRAVDELFETPLGQVTRLALNAPKSILAPVRMAMDSMRGQYDVRECHLAADGIIECTVDGLKSGPLFTDGMHTFGNVVLLDSGMTPDVRAYIRAHEVRHADQEALLGPWSQAITLLGRLAALTTSPRYEDCGQLDEMTAQDFAEGERLGIYNNYFNCLEVWDSLRAGDEKLINLR